MGMECYGFETKRYDMLRIVEFATIYPLISYGLWESFTILRLTWNRIFVKISVCVCVCVKIVGDATLKSQPLQMTMHNVLKLKNETAIVDDVENLIKMKMKVVASGAFFCWYAFNGEKHNQPRRLYKHEK